MCLRMSQPETFAYKRYMRDKETDIFFSAYTVLMIEDAEIRS